MNRRTFLLTTGATSLAGGFVGAAGMSAWSSTRAEVLVEEQPKLGELEADVIIIGGGVGGCAAALGAVREGATVILTEETDWLGGQLTTQCVPPDEHQYVETHGCNKEYRNLRTWVRDFYRKQTDPAMTATAKSAGNLNPGGGWVSRICAEPRVWLQGLEAQLEPAVRSGKLRILRNWTPISAEVNGDNIEIITGRTIDGRKQTLKGKYFLDATEMGDLLPMTKTEFVTGSESSKDTGEPSAKQEARPSNIQSFTWVFALDHRPGENHVIAKPQEYEFWRNHEPKLNPPSGSKRQISWLYPSPTAEGKPRLGFDPTKDKTEWGMNLWTYRRALDAKKFTAQSNVTDISLINWGQNDYHLGPLYGVSDEEAARHSANAKALSLSLLYWLQTEAPRADGKVGWPGLRLRPDVTGTVDGIAKRPYIRESRRLQAEFTVFEQHVSKPVRTAEHKGPGEARAVQFADSVGLGLYLYIDIHATCGGDNSGGTGVLPFQVPMGALIPKRVNNLLAACKNLGVTHITNGCYRLHTVEWSIGEAAGALAAFAVKTDKLPRQIRADKVALGDFQKRLTSGGVEIIWPPDAKN
ncbi:MAG: FAD-dependent oxidoreductase [Fimbriiglobus sp.]